MGLFKTLRKKYKIISMLLRNIIIGLHAIDMRLIQTSWTDIWQNSTSAVAYVPSKIKSRVIALCIVGIL